MTIALIRLRSWKRSFRGTFPRSSSNPIGQLPAAPQTVHPGGKNRSWFLRVRAQQQAMPIIGFLSGVSPSFSGRRRIRRGRRG
jgi:hypothetical protein